MTPGQQDTDCAVLGRRPVPGRPRVRAGVFIVLSAGKSNPESGLDASVPGGLARPQPLRCPVIGQRKGVGRVCTQLAVLARPALLAAQLRADFARRARRGVDVHIRRSGSNGLNEVAEVAAVDAYSRPSRHGR